jgi:hypothetical protein
VSRYAITASCVLLVCHYSAYTDEDMQCDESKPACGNCVKISSACSYVRAENLQDPLFLETGVALKDNIPSFSYADLELMHHWTATTAISLAEYEPYKSVMRDDVPLMAMNHRYLMLAYAILQPANIN